jgi:hypothetical protein
MEGFESSLRFSGFIKLVIPAPNKPIPTKTPPKNITTNQLHVSFSFFTREFFKFEKYA